MCQTQSIEKEPEAGTQQAPLKRSICGMYNETEVEDKTRVATKTEFRSLEPEELR